MTVSIAIFVAVLFLCCMNLPPSPAWRPTLERGKPRMFDELAEAIRPLQPPNRPNRITRSVDLHAQFHPDLNPALWNVLAERLRVRLPLLEPVSRRHWEFPNEFRTVFDLAEFVAVKRPWTEPPTSRTLSEWIDSQVYLVVRDTLVDALSVDESDVFRSAKLVDDLGAE